MSQPPQDAYSKGPGAGYGYSPQNQYPPQQPGQYAPQSGYRQDQGAYGVEPSPNVGWVIAGFLLFWPTGIPALFACQRASRALGAGDWATASAEGANAKKFGMISMWVAIGIFSLYFLGWILSFLLWGAAVSSLTY